MKRFTRMLSLVAALVLLPLPASFAQTVSSPAESLAVTYFDSDRNKVKAEQFSDGDDETGISLTRADTAEMSIQLPDGAQCQSLYIRLNSVATEASLQVLNSEIKKYETVQTMYSPGGEFIFKLAEPVTGKLRIQLTFAKTVRCRVLELQALRPRRTARYAARLDAQPRRGRRAAGV